MIARFVAHACALAGCIAFATVLDVTRAVASGYRLRAETAALLLADAMLLAPFVAAGYGLLVAGAIVVRRGPRAGVGPVRPRIGLALGLLALSLLALVVLVGALGRMAPPGHERLEPVDEGSAPPVAPSARTPNLLLIVLDTVRADHLGLYGAGRPVSPFLDSLAAEAIVFDRAVASSSYTLPTHATLFTGLHAESHGADLDPEGGLDLASLGRLDDRAVVAPLSPEATTLAELLQQARLDTGALCANSAYLYRPFGLAQGFDTYVDVLGLDVEARPIGLAIGARIGRIRWFWPFRRLLEGNERYYLLADEIDGLAFEWLRPRKDRRFFLFLNYMDAHAPYLPIGPWRDVFPRAGEELRPDRFAIRRRERAITADEYAVATDAYHAEIRYLDDRLRALYEELEALGLLDTTAIVIVGDHGESFGEHHRVGHADSVYESEVRVPLLIRPPGGTEGRRVAETVHQVDVMPTVLDLLGLPIPDGLEGVSLLDGRALESRPVPIVARLGAYQRTFSESAVYEDGWKWVRDSRGGGELYHLTEDPDETRDLSAELPDRVSALAARLAEFEGRVHRRFSPSRPELDAEALERLRALGYAE